MGPGARNGQPFSEKGFYLGEFRGRTLALALPASGPGSALPLEAVLKELEANGTRVVLLSTEAGALDALLAAPVEPPQRGLLEVAVWRRLRESPRVGLVGPRGGAFGAWCREVALCLGISKLVWIDSAGGLRRADGGRESFVDLAGLRQRLSSGLAAEGSERTALMREIEAGLAAGLPAINLCTAEGIADELFTYAGSGTLFTRERYVAVRRLTLDDFDAAHDLVARGVEEGYLAPRPVAEIERVLASGFGAFVEGRHLAGIGALLVHESDRVGEIASLYTLTRFLGEGIGGHLVGFAVERARERGCEAVVACTTSERVMGFFERQGFERVPPETLPEAKWRDYEPARRARVCCLRREI